MTTRKPKQSKMLPDLQPQNTEAVKAGEGMSPADAARGSLSPSEAARLGRPATRGGLGGGLTPK